MYDANHAVEYHTTHLAEARDELVSIVDQLQGNPDTTDFGRLRVLLNDVTIQIQVHTQLLEQAVSMLDEPKPASFWKRIFQK